MNKNLVIQKLIIVHKVHSFIKYTSRLQFGTHSLRKFCCELNSEIDVVTGIIPPSYELPDLEEEPLLEGGNA